MSTQAFSGDLPFNDAKVSTAVVLETSFSKEIRILMKSGQQMKEHRAPFPIIVHMIQGEIQFGVEGEKSLLTEGDILSLDANVPHDLVAKADSVVRLTLSKDDSHQRVQDVTS